MKSPNRLLLIMAVITPLFFTACASLRSLTTLSQVEFTLDHISSVKVAGIDLMRIDSPEQLNMYQIARASLALSREDLPLELTLHLRSENPQANQIAATLTRLDWTLILDGRETISGTLHDSVRLPAGDATDIPLRLRLNMFEFFNEKSAMDMLDMALAFAAEDGRVPQGLTLKVRPTIDTIFGPMTYGKPILIEPKPHVESESRAF
ncbi:MAG: hypothetical protein COW18_13970 [Zetaproteobacteria bacterium CG12_big_fil_rev_8_21_14_0_65_54_13]|nr:MAG: hypothetical protein COW18_13970 [Zetaproteobacteria bacterium CG12_big_fil_rev_8_21_14_0_65_54_13]PIX54510.1 MAG: hypothetical protein COZ50_07645 [Zetaproteobacteria bacterium CG_4_10_14_3_um_filter_54_28]PJA28683.1 MAG: hypothetical protein CO188_08675 [Zetaproteobacteria bacterium CG_4_9_14_3_um_filter_54_145]